MTSVAALGFGDIPPDAFAEAYNLIEVDGLVGFSLKEEMVSGERLLGLLPPDRSGDHRARAHVKREHRYRHRLDAKGDPLYYVAMIAEKRRDLPVSG